MEPCDVLIRCSFRSDFSSTGLDNLTFCLLTNLTTIGKDDPSEKNEGTVYCEKGWIWLFYAKPNSTLELRLCRCDKTNHQFESIASEISTHRFQVPNVSADQAITLELKWNEEFSLETISIDDILNENEDLFEKLPLNSDYPNDPSDVNDNDTGNILIDIKGQSLKCEENANNSAKVSPKIRFKITTESLDSICGSSSEIEEIMSHQNNKLGIPIPSKTSSSDIASSSSDKKSSGNVSKVNELPEEDEVFSVMETEDGLVDIDKLLFESGNSMELQNFQTVRTAPVVDEPQRSRSHVLMTKLHALFGFGGLKFSEPNENKKNDKNLLGHTSASENMDKDYFEKLPGDENNTKKTDDEFKENIIENENVEVIEIHENADQNTIFCKESSQSESDNFEKKEDLLKHTFDSENMDKDYFEKLPGDENNTKKTEDEFKENIIENENVEVIEIHENADQNTIFCKESSQSESDNFEKKEDLLEHTFDSENKNKDYFEKLPGDENNTKKTDDEFKENIIENENVEVIEIHENADQNTIFCKESSQSESDNFEKKEDLLKHTFDSENMDKDYFEKLPDDENNTKKTEDEFKENIIENENVEVIEIHENADQNTIFCKESSQSESDNFEKKEDLLKHTFDSENMDKDYFEKLPGDENNTKKTEDEFKENIIENENVEVIEIHENADQNTIFCKESSQSESDNFEKKEDLLEHTFDSENKNKDYFEKLPGDENNTKKTEDEFKENIIENENVEVIEIHENADQNTIFCKESFQSESDNFEKKEDLLKHTFDSENMDKDYFEKLPGDENNTKKTEDEFKENIIENENVEVIEIHENADQNTIFCKESFQSESDNFEKKEDLLEHTFDSENKNKDYFEKLPGDENNTKKTDDEFKENIIKNENVELIEIHENADQNTIFCKESSQCESENFDSLRNSFHDSNESNLKSEEKGFNEFISEKEKLSFSSEPVENLKHLLMDLASPQSFQNLREAKKIENDSSNYLKCEVENENQINLDFKSTFEERGFKIKKDSKLSEDSKKINQEIHQELEKDKFEYENSSYLNKNEDKSESNAKAEEIDNNLEAENTLEFVENNPCISLIKDEFQRSLKNESKIGVILSSENKDSEEFEIGNIYSIAPKTIPIPPESFDQNNFEKTLDYDDINPILTNSLSNCEENPERNISRQSYQRPVSHTFIIQSKGDDIHSNEEKYTNKDITEELRNLSFENNDIPNIESNFISEIENNNCKDEELSYLRKERPMTPDTDKKHHEDRGNKLRKEQLNLESEKKNETNRGHKMEIKGNFELIDDINLTSSESFSSTELANDGTMKLKEYDIYSEVPLSSEISEEIQDNMAKNALSTKNENEIKISFINYDQTPGETENGCHFLGETEKNSTSLNRLKVITKDEEYFSDLEPISEEFDDKLSNQSDNEVDHYLTNDIVSNQTNMSTNFSGDNIKHTSCFKLTPGTTIPNRDNGDQIKINLEKPSSQTCSKSFQNSDLGNSPSAINQNESFQSTKDKTNKSDNGFIYQIPLIYTSNQNFNIDYDNVILMENNLNFSLQSTETSFIPTKIAGKIDLNNSLQKLTSMPENNESNSNGFNINISCNETKINENLQLQEIESNDSSLVTTLSKESLDGNLSTDNLYEKFIPTSETSFMTHPIQEDCVSSVASQHIASRATNETKDRELKETSYTGNLDVIENEYYIDRLKNQGCREIKSIDNQIHNVGETGVNACLIDDNTKHQDINLLTNISAISNSGSNNCSNAKLLDFETNDRFNLVIDSSDPEFHADNFDKSSMLNPMLCIFLSKDRNQLKFEEQGKDSTLMQQGFKPVNKLSVETSISSNRDFAIICDSDLISDSQSAVDTIVQDDSFEEFVYNHPMTTSQTVDSLFISALSSNKQTISEENEPCYFSRENSHEVIFDDTHLFLSDKNYSSKPANPNEYCSLPIPHKSKMKRSPALDGVCDLLKKTDSELKLIEQQTNLIINDDDLYLDAVTPSKADSTLRFGERIYDFPFIDDESSNDDLLFNILLERYPVRVKLADCDECTLISTADLLDQISVEKSPKQLIATVVKKKSKTRNKFFRLCGCLSRKGN